jgi:hypothetical protein
MISQDDNNSDVEDRSRFVAENDLRRCEGTNSAAPYLETHTPITTLFLLFKSCPSLPTSDLVSEPSSCSRHDGRENSNY